MKKPSTVLQLLILGVTFSSVCAFALAQTPAVSDGWYTAAQAVNGAKAYQKTCAGCHGAKCKVVWVLRSSGKQFWLAYGGKKVSTLWSAVHTQMPMMAPGSVSAKNSINIFCCKRTGYPLAPRRLTIPLICPKYFH